MGYDVTMKIGRAIAPGPEYKRSETPEIDGNKLYFPYVEDENKKWIKTGRTEIQFFGDIILDLCVIGEGPLMKLVDKSRVKLKKPTTVYKWYDDGDNDTEKDSYGDRWVPVEIDKVIVALKKQLALDSQKEQPYRRFLWALGLLEAMRDTASDMVVLFHGH